MSIKSTRGDIYKCRSSEDDLSQAIFTNVVLACKRRNLWMSTFRRRDDV